MKVTLVQPRYSMRYEDADACFEAFCAILDTLDESSDIVVLPEYCDVPVSTPGKDAFDACIEKFNPVLRERIPALAKRLHAMVFANYAEKSDDGYRNATHCFDREGNETGIYFKAHPAPSEVKTKAQGGNGMDCAYSYEYAKPYVLEMEGLRFGFMTCYDFYMYEAFSRIAKEKVDIIIGCSHQRTDTHQALDIIGRFLSYNTNAYLLRSAVSMGEDSPVCGCSMAVAPDGTMLLDAKNGVGAFSVQIDPAVKYEKPAGFKGLPKPHHEYIDEGRRPWLYRPAGSMTVPSDKDMPYPRVCAHRGFNSVAPENSLPAWGAAVALGAQEIEFDIWPTKDGQLVSLHDPTLDRVSDGHGHVTEYTLEELRRFDFGVTRGERFKGLRIVTFEEILKKFACTCIMNIHVKTWREPMYEQIASLLRQYGCERHCYIMSSDDEAMMRFHEVAPEIRRCVGFDGNQDDLLAMVKRAKRIGADKVQLFKPWFTQQTVDAAHEAGLLCNVFYADDPEEAKKYLAMGIDCVLTNDYLTVANALGI